MLFVLSLQTKSFLWHGNKILWILNQQCLKLVALIKYTAAAEKYILLYLVPTPFLHNKFTTSNFYCNIILDRSKKCDKSYSCFEVEKIAPFMCYCQSLKVYNKHNSLLLNFLPFSNYSCRDISLKIVFIKPCITVYILILFNP